MKPIKNTATALLLEELEHIDRLFQGKAKRAIKQNACLDILQNNQA